MSTIEIKVPMLPESVADATVSAWHKKPGDQVVEGENLVDLETDKVILEVPAPQSGILKEIKKQQGETVTASEILGLVEAGATQAAAPKAAETVATTSPTPAATTTSYAGTSAAALDKTHSGASHSSQNDNLSPAVRRLVAEKEIDPSQINGSGKGGRVTKEDVLNKSQNRPESVSAPVALTGERPEKRVPMTRLRARIAERLLEAQQNAAILTTFNEVNLQAIMDLRTKYKDQFEKVHKQRLGFMSFFTKAAVEALKRFPAVNASIDGNDIVYHGYFDIGIAVSTERGLVVPILRDADQKSMAEIEGSIVDFGNRAKAGQLSIEEMTGGTFTITNGGVFGSLLSTPILNPPQSAILGMHKIEQRPVVENGQIVIRPMMYLALSYDHRIIDGKESVQFLVAIKELLEDPARLILEI